MSNKFHEETLIARGFQAGQRVIYTYNNTAGVILKVDRNPQGQEEALVQFDSEQQYTCLTARLREEQA